MLVLEQDRSVRAIIEAASWQARLGLIDKERTAMQQSESVLREAVGRGEPVYGVTQGFGPLVAYGASSSAASQGLGLVAHLAAGQGTPLRPEVTRLMIWLRLVGMKQSYSGVSPDCWLALADLWNQGCTPVVPCDGSLSASGDLVPLAHAAQAFAGEGEVWRGSTETGWQRLPARQVLPELGVEPIRWTAREALAFVNGTSASLAQACYNHDALRTLAWATAFLTGRMVFLLGANPEPYHPALADIRGLPGQQVAAGWIREEYEIREVPKRDPARPLQEPYSLRCGPQIIGAVVDQLRLQEDLLVGEALGCSDNPVVYGDRVLHGGNFHAASIGLCSDQQALCAHQLAFMAERQLALLLNPIHNGNRPAMLTPSPGPQSGFAGVQLAATSMVAKIRQNAYPATLTALPSNLDNQDHVPMAFNGANAVAEILRLSWLVAGSLALALNQWSHLAGQKAEAGSFWRTLQTMFEPLEEDRPLADEVARAARLLQEHASAH